MCGFYRGDGSHLLASLLSSFKEKEGFGGSLRAGGGGGGEGKEEHPLPPRGSKTRSDSPATARR